MLVIDSLASWFVYFSPALLDSNGFSCWDVSVVITCITNQKSQIKNHSYTHENHTHLLKLQNKEMWILYTRYE